MFISIIAFRILFACASSNFAPDSAVPPSPSFGFLNTVGLPFPLTLFLSASGLLIPESYPTLLPTCPLTSDCFGASNFGTPFFPVCVPCCPAVNVFVPLPPCVEPVATEPTPYLGLSKVCNCPSTSLSGVFTDVTDCGLPPLFNSFSFSV